MTATWEQRLAKYFAYCMVRRATEAHFEDLSYSYGITIPSDLERIVDKVAEAEWRDWYPLAMACVRGLARIGERANNTGALKPTTEEAPST